MERETEAHQVLEEAPAGWQPTPEAVEAPTELARSVPISGVKSPRVEEALGQWSQFVENFETSAVDFYNSLEEALARRKIPGISVRQVTFAEGGILDANRHYFRIERESLKIDVCAAPFGTGYFFSWWLSGKRGLWWLLPVLLSAAALVALWKIRFIGFGTRFMGTGIVLLLLFVGLPLARRAINRLTYYAVDTTAMFRSAVHAAVTETIDGLLKAKGMRALAEDQKRPVMREFLAK